MIICIPTIGNEGQAARVHDHFGSAPFFALCNTETGETETVDNGNLHHAHGMCQPLAVFADRKIDAVVCGGMGARAVQKLNAGGIRAYRALPGTVAEILAQFAAGKLPEITAKNSCGHHPGCH